MQFTVRITSWSNPENLSVEAWARRRVDPKSILSGAPVIFSNTSGYRLRRSSMVAGIVDIVVARGNRIYELSYMDVTGPDMPFSESVRRCWSRALDRMVQSWKFA